MLQFIDLSSSTGWCQLAYWELNERVGRLVPVDVSAINVFAEQTRGAGLCIKTLAEERLKKTPVAVLKTREKIGLGKKIAIIIIFLFQINFYLINLFNFRSNIKS